MGRRPSFRPEQSAWVSDQLLRSTHATREREVWRALFAAFQRNFPDARTIDGASVTLERYRHHVKYLERRQETNPAARVAAHMRRHELLDMEERRMLTQRANAAMSTAEGEEEQEQEQEEEEEEEEGHVEMRILIKSEPTIERVASTSKAASTAKSAPQVKKRRPLLRTRQAASAVAASAVTDKGETQRTAPMPEVKMEPTATATASIMAPTTSSGAVQMPPVPKKRRTLSAASKTPLELAQREVQEWKFKFEAEKKTSDALESRLHQALDKLDKKERLLQHLQSTSALAASQLPSGGGASSNELKFTLNVNVLQNGQHVHVTTEALQLNGESPPLG